MHYRSKQRTKTSIRVLQIAMGGLALIILGRLVQLQIVEHDTYGPLSRENALRQETVTPARGLIFDRNGRLLVDNEPIYTITITPARYDNSKSPVLADIMDVSLDVVERRVQEARDYSWYRSSRLFTEVDFRKFSVLQENIWRLPGIGHQLESKRHYPVDSLQASHVMGYLREVSQQEYESSRNYHLGDKVGKSGLEMVYENHLRGESGIEYIKINALGQSLGSYDNGSLDESPVKGADLYTTLDAGLQVLAEDLMEGLRGAAVAIDPDNGAILSLVSAPQYDIRKLSGRIDSAYWQQVNADTTDPLYNRAISSIQPPGSTFKPLMALMGLEMGLITPETEINNPGYYQRGRRYNDLAPPGAYDVGRALEESSNTFFFWLMDRMANSRSINRWHELASDFGFGKASNVDLPYENAGILPDSAWLNRNLGEGRWGIGDMMSLGVGQGFISATPLQMAQLAAQIGNGGYRIRPHLVNTIRQSDGTVRYTDTPREKIAWVDEENLEVVKSGMRRVVQNGGARIYADLDSVRVAGKTGTAQNPHGADHGWFIAFAPMDDPQIAVAVLVENAGYGSQSAAPIASLMIEQYLNGRIGDSWERQFTRQRVEELKAELRGGGSADSVAVPTTAPSNTEDDPQ
ncbi:MAG: penicillin-binding protein 2 [Balneolaceae bacterium]|nr:penicillin-binding protein 2 [Balneolaceae bacterium]